jgi:hypothetical protein
MTSTVSTKLAMTVGAIFNDHSIFCETLRTLGYAPYGGGAHGEVVGTAGRIPDSDETAWSMQWQALARSIHAGADHRPTDCHAVDARKYHRLCEFNLRVDSANPDGGSGCSTEGN